MKTATLSNVSIAPLSKNGHTVNDVLKLITPELRAIGPIVITPDMATDLLTLNDANRPIKKWLVTRYKNLMLNGKWIFAGNTICFDRNRRQQQGQHTLLAIKESETAQMLILVTGLEPLAYTVMDSGAQRTGGDVLAVMGFHQNIMLASAIKSIIYLNTTRAN